MWGCRSSRPVPAARREERVSNKHFFAPQGPFKKALEVPERVPKGKDPKIRPYRLRSLFWDNRQLGSLDSASLGPQTPLAGLGFKVQQLWIEQYCRKVVFTVLI